MANKRFVQYSFSCEAANGTRSQGEALAALTDESTGALGSVLNTGLEIEKATAHGLMSMWEYGGLITFMVLVIIGITVISGLVIRWLIQNNQDMAAKMLTMSVDTSKAITTFADSVRANTDEMRDFINAHYAAQNRRRPRSRARSRKGTGDATQG